MVPRNAIANFLAYVSGDEAQTPVPPGIRTRRVAANSFLCLGFDLTMTVREDQPDLLLVQYTAPLGCTVPVVVASDRSREAAVSTVRERFANTGLILSVGDIQPRKNHIGLIRAFANLVREVSAVEAQSGAGRKAHLVRG